MNSKTGLVSIIILNYNGEKYLEDCLESIFRETKHDFEVIVVDNNSPDTVSYTHLTLPTKA